MAEDIFTYSPAPFNPSISVGGEEPLYLIRGKNWWLRSLSQDTMYLTAYKGSRAMGENVPARILPGKVSINTTDQTILEGGDFKEYLRPGTFLLGVGGGSSYFAVVEEVISDTRARLSTPLSTAFSAADAYIVPGIQALGTKRATLERGNVVRYPQGHLLAVGRGELRLDGQSLAVAQVHKLTVVGAVTGDGTLVFTLTIAGMTGSPIATNVNVVSGDSPTVVAEKAVKAMIANANITAEAVLSSYGPDIYIRRKVTGNDATMNLGYALGTATGPTAVPNSTSIADGTGFFLTAKPQYAMYDVATDTYEIEDYGVALPPDTATAPIIAVVGTGGGTKNMFAGDYGIRVVARSDDATGGTGGFSDPSANYVVTITANQKIRITFNRAMNVHGGQNAWDIFVTKYENSTQAALNRHLGPWYRYSTVTAAELATENSVADGTVSGMVHDIEFADGELEALNELLTFSNDPAVEAEYVDLVTFGGTSPLFISCLGQRRTGGDSLGSSPGPAVVPGKAGNPEAVLLRAKASTSQGDSILGSVVVRGRHWLLCENSLQTSILTGVPNQPVTLRSFWDVGFRNPYNVRFVKDYFFGHSTGGFLRSIGVGDTSNVDFEFSIPIDDYTRDWVTAQVLTEHDPKNQAACFFFSGKSKRDDYYETIVLPFLRHQGIWNPPIVIDGRAERITQSVTGTAGASTNLPVTVTATGMTGSPKTINVAVNNGDSNAVIAGKVRTALNGDADVTAVFTVGGSGNVYHLTKRTRQAADPVLALTHSAITGVSASGPGVKSFELMQDMVVGGVAVVGQKLFFTAGGRRADGTVSFDVYEFDADDHTPYECVAGWAFSDLGREELPQAVKGVASFVGAGTDVEVEIHGMPSEGVIDLDLLEDGHGDDDQTIRLGNQATLGRIMEKRQEMPQFAKTSVRLRLDSVNGSGRLDELNMKLNPVAGSRK